MDVDLESVEIVFAQKLACGEPPVRARALRTLQEWMQAQSAKRAFNEADMMRLCKGLHYVMWMQDKMLMQEELADKISALPENFATEEERVLFFKCALKSLGKEWSAIDRWRMDKFLMLMRRMVRAVFHLLRGKKWLKKRRDLYVEALEQTVISADSSIPESLKFHFASLFLDELDLAGGLNKKQVLAMLEPFFKLLRDDRISRYLFESILTEIFTAILYQFSASLDERIHSDEDEQSEDDTPACARMDEALRDRQSIQFDYAAIGKALFDIGKRAECLSERRGKLYSLSKKFELASCGRDPFAAKEYVAEEVLTEDNIQDAATRLIESENDTKRLRKEYSKAKKVRASDHVAMVAPDIVRDHSASKIRKEMKKKMKQMKKKRVGELVQSGGVEKKKKKAPGTKKQGSKKAKGKAK